MTLIGECDNDIYLCHRYSGCDKKIWNTVKGSVNMTKIQSTVNSTFGAMNVWIASNKWQMDEYKNFCVEGDIGLWNTIGHRVVSSSLSNNVFF